MRSGSQAHPEKGKKRKVRGLGLGLLASSGFSAAV